MTREATYRIESIAELQARMGAVWHMAGKGLEQGPVEVALRRPHRQRSTQANRLMWKLLNDIAGQLEWAGGKLSPEDWKDLITASMRRQTVVPGLDGGLVALGGRTSKMTKAEFSDLIECIRAVGSERGVNWSDASNAQWDEYREAANES